MGFSPGGGGISSIGSAADVAPSSAAKQGDISELLVYNRIITSSERATVDSYVQDRYAITVPDHL